MRSRVHQYVAAVIVLAVVIAGFLVWRGPAASSANFGDALLLCVLAIAGELLSYALPQSATGSIGFIPYFAAAVLAPNWASVFSVALVRAALELWVRRKPIKGIFNIATWTLTQSVAVLVYLGFGGVSLLHVASTDSL